MIDQPDHWKEGQGILLECNGEKWLAEIVMTSKNGGSLMIGFNGTIRGHLNYMPVMYEGKGIYRSIIDGTEARLKAAAERHCQMTDDIKTCTPNARATFIKSLADNTIIQTYLPMGLGGTPMDIVERFYIAAAALGFLLIAAMALLG